MDKMEDWGLGNGGWDVEIICGHSGEAEPHSHNSFCGASLNSEKLSFILASTSFFGSKNRRSVLQTSATKRMKFMSIPSEQAANTTINITFWFLLSSLTLSNTLSASKVANTARPNSTRNAASWASAMCHTRPTVEKRRETRMWGSTARQRGNGCFRRQSRKEPSRATQKDMAAKGMPSSLSSTHSVPSSGFSEILQSMVVPFVVVESGQWKPTKERTP